MKKINLHSHTQFCDAKAPMSEMADAAFRAGFDVWGFSPHSPVPIDSPCNMSKEDVPLFIKETESLKLRYEGRMKIYTGMEIDYLFPDSGPASDYYQSLPLDYRIGSVHFVPTRSGELIDCDGSVDRFRTYLVKYFDNDAEYVVKTYFSQVLKMISAGGFDILGHCDKIAGNISEIDPEIEYTQWYYNLMKDMLKEAVNKNCLIEINTKAFSSRKRFYPDSRWWNLLKELNADVIFSTDAHYPDKVDAGLDEAIRMSRLEQSPLFLS